MYRIFPAQFFVNIHMGTYKYKLISELSAVDNIEDNDILLISRKEVNTEQFVSKKTDAKNIRQYIGPTVDNKIKQELSNYIHKDSEENIVFTNTDQSITGTKTFEDEIISKTEKALIVKNPLIDLSVDSNTNLTCDSIIFQDKNGNNSQYGFHGVLLDLDNNDKTMYSRFGVARQPEDSGNEDDKLYSYMKIGIPARKNDDRDEGVISFHGITDMNIPYPGDDNSIKDKNKAASTKWVKTHFMDKNDDIVDLSDNISSTDKVPHCKSVVDWCNENFLKSDIFIDPSEVITMLSSMMSESSMTCYVDCLSGSDSNDGSHDKPFKTIYKAVQTANKRRFIGNSQCTIILLSDIELSVSE